MRQSPYSRDPAKSYGGNIIRRSHDKFEDKHPKRPLVGVAKHVMSAEEQQRAQLQSEYAKSKPKRALRRERRAAKQAFQANLFRRTIWNS